MDYTTLETPIGRLTIVADGDYVIRVLFDGETMRGAPNANMTAVLHRATTQLAEYFAGTRTAFDVPLKPAGGAFFQHVWAIMRERVPYGTTTTYGELAQMAGAPNAARAVGNANNRNPIPIFIPCHRVIGKNGTLTGFRAGLEIKRKLLGMEMRI
jgi:methylated-DNA-[protein]-cysteine S-methyltransferase